MNKFVLFFSLIVIGCSTSSGPKRQVLDCSEIVTDPQMVSKDQYKWCTYKQIPVAPKSTPLAIDPLLIDKNQN